LLARSIQLVYGHDCLTWDDLWLSIEELILEVPQRSLAGENIIKSSLAQRHREQRDAFAADAERTNGDLNDFLHKYARADCTDERDRVIGVLSLVVGGKTFVPNYEWGPPELALRTLLHFEGGPEMLIGL